MNTTETIDAQELPQGDSQAVAVVKKKELELSSAGPMTPAQAKVEAVAKLTMSAYERASMLELSKDEVSALIADFPDEAFQPGAAGKEHLLYIEHAHLRDRLSSVFGMGKWAIVPRNRWEETFKTTNGKEAHRVYVEAMLLVRGCFVAEAVGDMVYYPHNESQNYGDAVEGAKTAALRRCAKELGVGLQAWKKDWCAGWWERKRGGKPAYRPKPQPSEPAETEASFDAAQPEPAKPKPSTAIPFPTAESRTKMIAAVESLRPVATEYFHKIAALLPTETLEDVPLRFVPATKGQMTLLMNKIAMFEAGDQAVPAYPPHPEPEKPIEVPRGEVDTSDKAEEWRAFPMPFGKMAGTPLGDLEKKYLYGLAMNYTVETEFNGKPKKTETIEKDRKFRQMLDQASVHYGFKSSDQ